MRNVFAGACTALIVIAGLTAPAQAAPLTVTCPTFGDLSQATFGGTDIPNDRVCSSTVVVSGETLVVGLTATQRFGNPVVTDDGAGTYYATPGGDVLNGEPTFGKWNFDFFVSSTGGDHLVELFYDFDAAADTDLVNLGVLSSVMSGLGVSENSWNLGMPFLLLNIPGIDAPPGAFNPNATGEYSFGLRISGVGGEEAFVSMNVNVEEAAPVPEPASMLLFGSGLVGLVALRRRKAAK